MRAAVLGSERLGHDQQTEQEIDEGQPGAHHERQPQVRLAEQPAERRSGDEAETEGDADQAEVRRALLGRTDVGDVGAGRREGRAKHAGDDAAQHEPPDRRRQAEQDVVEAQPGQRQQNHRPPSEAVRQRAQDRARRRTA